MRMIQSVPPSKNPVPAHSVEQQVLFDSHAASVHGTSRTRLDLLAGARRIELVRNARMRDNANAAYLRSSRRGRQMAAHESQISR